MSRSSVRLVILPTSRSSSDVSLAIPSRRICGHVVVDGVSALDGCRRTDKGDRPAQEGGVCVSSFSIIQLLPARMGHGSCLIFLSPFYKLPRSPASCPQRAFPRLGGVQAPWWGALAHLSALKSNQTKQTTAKERRKARRPKSGPPQEKKTEQPSPAFLALEVISLSPPSRYKFP